MDGPNSLIQRRDMRDVHHAYPFYVEAAGQRLVIEARATRQPRDLATSPVDPVPNSKS